jgi:kynurenine formamidase
VGAVALLASLKLAVGVAAAMNQTTAAPAAARSGQSPQTEVNDTRTTKLEFERWAKELSNWGRWGKEDELGAVNLITSTKRQQAAALAKTGMSVSLAHNLVTEKAVDAQNPYVLRPRTDLTSPYAFDRQDVDYHGYTFSHLDALCHVSYNGKLYNGLDFRTTVTNEEGCKKLGITNIKDRIVTRGVLIDLPRLKNVPYLDAGTHVYREDIEAWERQAGVRVEAGDAILLRTGRWARRAKIGPFRNVAGFDASVAPFFKERDVSLIGSDGVQDVGTLPGVALPIHTFAIAILGVNLFDNLDLETLADTAAKLKRWEFLLVAGPTPVTNGSGSPINPVAIF